MVGRYKDRSVLILVTVTVPLVLPRISLKMKKNVTVANQFTVKLQNC
jgi:hypothetical protein